MIYVTLGTQDKPFHRLLTKIEEQMDKGNIKEEVVVQAGYTKYPTEKMKVFDLVDRDEFVRLMNECNILITHGGVGSILTGLKNHKKVIACPRLYKYGEHMNDHQMQIISNFAKEGYLLELQENDDLGEALKKAETFVPKPFSSNTDKFVTIIEEFIDNN